MARRVIDVEEQGPIRLVVSGHMPSLELVGQHAVNEIIRRKFYGLVDSPFADKAPWLRITIEMLEDGLLQ